MEHSYGQLLTASGLKKTAPRLAILKLLNASLFPMTVAKLRSSLAKMKINEATFYRAVDTLVEKGVLSRLYLSGTEASYEIATRPHHHHIVCTRCNKIEDLEDCSVADNIRSITNKSRFAKITSHSLELFGICKTCSRK